LKWFYFVIDDKCRQLLVAMQQDLHYYLYYFCGINQQNVKMGLLGSVIVEQYAGWIGTPEIIIIVVVILLLFGGKKIPELMRGMGKGIKEFKEGIADDTNKDKNKSENDDTKDK
jgi:sec-independent protein translocase protein TatA